MTDAIPPARVPATPADLDAIRVEIDRAARVLAAIHDAGRLPADGDAVLDAYLGLHRAALRLAGLGAGPPPGARGGETADGPAASDPDPDALTGHIRVLPTA